MMGFEQLCAGVNPSAGIQSRKPVQNSPLGVVYGLSIGLPLHLPRTVLADFRHQ